MSSFIKHVAEDATREDIKEIFASDTTLLVACASFVPKCKDLLKDIESMESDYEKEKLHVWVIQIDESDELEEIAIELGLTFIPSFQIYQCGKLAISSKEGDDVTVDSIRDSLKETFSSTSSSCCAPPSNSNDVLKLVATSYANTVNKSESCCVSVDSTMMGYSPEDLVKAGLEANLGLGCGNPLGFANLQPGETVVDLGSGAGIDCFLAADKVGPTGSVIGVDMTPDMIFKARSNAKKNADLSGNVQFRLGEIEHLPIADNSVDCVVSNCVINLSPDKQQVYNEIYRILKKGGRVAISDVVTRPEKIIPEELKTAEALAC
mmetsp:Transcript_14478/g.21346  ORF Transcript_14478/g.21346 Transcript_14478/m.21346 type:complete len:321 (-) Transcript_14478:387-1349(-)|eukprot:CAMPEP_0195529872 /NCGR_PEP_ID=MMETSP0794_2-20130614/32517_1 /TAXON_ID=515487 /ORGANISM="Stephanopyxis turris, Strain CCMP 815" /LENGTH=320 /DNA_ID=CAMNT_0040661247 /DNA_START=42 /DNA_END=1004 /DNA_ORIENTATION=-